MIDFNLFKKIFAIVTAYHHEPVDVIKRTISSVRSMKNCGFEVKHYIVCDGANLEFSDPNLIVINLPSSHNDFGDTPRLIGATLAIRDGCYGLMFLDADNMIYENHLQLTLEAHSKYEANLVVTMREMLTPDCEIINIKNKQEENLEHVDTGCFVFFRDAIFDVLEWIKIPAPMSVLGDRYFWNILKNTKKIKAAVVQEKTVGYTCLWEDIYLSAGLKPPPDAKTLNLKAHSDFIARLTEDERCALASILHLNFNNA